MEMHHLSHNEQFRMGSYSALHVSEQGRCTEARKEIQAPSTESCLRNEGNMPPAWSFRALQNAHFINVHEPCATLHFCTSR